MTEAPGPLYRAVKDALAAAVVGDAVAAAEAVTTIVEGGPAEVHAALCAWAAVVLKASGHGDSPGDGGGPGSWVIEVTNAVTGESMNLEETSLAPSDQDVLRIVACVGNSDHDTLAAIVRMYWERGPAPLAQLLTSFVKLSATMAKQLVR